MNRPIYFRHKSGISLKFQWRHFVTTGFAPDLFARQISEFKYFPFYPPVSVRHHLAGREMLLSSRFAALIVAIFGNMSSWISGNFFFVWFNYCVLYSKTHWFIPNKTKKDPVTRAIAGTEVYILYWATSRAEVLYVLLRPLPGTDVPLWRCE
jgi:hypothetical protein